MSQDVPAHQASYLRLDLLLPQGFWSRHPPMETALCLVFGKCSFNPLVVLNVQGANSTLLQIKDKVSCVTYLVDTSDEVSILPCISSSSAPSSPVFFFF